MRHHARHGLEVEQQGRNLDRMERRDQREEQLVREHLQQQLEIERLSVAFSPAAAPWVEPLLFTGAVPQLLRLLRSKSQAITYGTFTADPCIPPAVARHSPLWSKAKSSRLSRIGVASPSSQPVFKVSRSTKFWSYSRCGPLSSRCAPESPELEPELLSSSSLG